MGWACLPPRPGVVPAASIPSPAAAQPARNPLPHPSRLADRNPPIDPPSQPPSRSSPPTMADRTGPVPAAASASASAAARRVAQLAQHIAPRGVGGLLADVDPDGLREYSVVYTDRAVNHMSAKFQAVMKGISRILKKTYNASTVAVIPGSGSYAMEAVARQFASNKRVLVIRNGYFSYRWSDIFKVCGIPAHETVLKAMPAESGANPAFAPHPIDAVVRAIKTDRPAVVFAPHVETASGIILPDAYLKQVADAAHEVGALFVLDCIASGCVWVDMKELGLDVVISAPQKGWSGPACSGLVMLSDLATEALETTQSTSFVANLQQWVSVMKAYEDGAHKYYTTMPTDALTRVHDAMAEADQVGLAKVKELQLRLGREVRAMLASLGIKSVAANGFGAAGVVVSYAAHADVYKRFLDAGMQIAGGVPLMCGGITDSQSDDFRTFRLGLFGLDKLDNIPRTVAVLKETLLKCPGLLTKTK